MKKIWKSLGIGLAFAMSFVFGVNLFHGTDIDFEEFEESFTQLRPPLEKGYSFGLVGDWGEIDNDIFEVVDMYNEISPNEELELGDGFYDSGLEEYGEKCKYTSRDGEKVTSACYVAKYRRYFFANETAAKRPKNYVAGNHEWYGGVASIYAILKHHSEEPSIYAPYPYWSARYGRDVCLIGLDTEHFRVSDNWAASVLRLNSVESYEQAQYDYVKNTMKGCSDVDTIIVIGHHNYKSCAPSGHRPASGSFKKAMDQLIIGKADFYISGHLHIGCYDGEVQGTHLITSGHFAKTYDEKGLEPIVYGTTDPGFAVLRKESAKGWELSFYNKTGKIWSQVLKVR